MIQHNLGPGLAKRNPRLTMLLIPLPDAIEIPTFVSRVEVWRGVIEPCQCVNMLCTTFKESGGRAYIRPS